ncbi:uncharacterized protein [Amphiura filiformis]|uniref:uncharacterized protein n=1 Tax=Amphiura filiformis TaxID=82378 RepID=UPI003B20EB05
MSRVCDGKSHCPAGDDEIRCDSKRCPTICKCYYPEMEHLAVECQNGWSTETLRDVPQITKTLFINKGNVTMLALGLLKGYSQLISLSLAENGIFQIQNGTFHGLTSLSWLDLSNNELTTLVDGLFAELLHLRNLFLLNVPLKLLYGATFTGLGTLHTL